jgi:hypothetical protein
LQLLLVRESLEVHDERAVLMKRFAGACERYRRELKESRAMLKESIADLERAEGRTRGGLEVEREARASTAVTRGDPRDGSGSARGRTVSWR